MAAPARTSLPPWQWVAGTNWPAGIVQGTAKNLAVLQVYYFSLVTIEKMTTPRAGLQRVAWHQALAHGESALTNIVSAKPPRQACLTHRRHVKCFHRALLSE